MLARIFLLALAVTSVQLIGQPARACGFAEAPSDCGDAADGVAKWMLKRVVAAIEADKAAALREFTRGEGGFRTADSYVFCVGPDGVMTAHPNPILQGQNVIELHDQTGNYFIATMLKTARPGVVSDIRYLFPRPGSTTATPKTTFYTRAGDQVCGVGVYDADDNTAAPTTPEQRAAQLRQRLQAEMPASLSGDWSAFLQALDETSRAQSAALTDARDRIHAAEAVLDKTPRMAASP